MICNARSVRIAITLTGTLGVLAVPAFAQTDMHPVPTLATSGVVRTYVPVDTSSSAISPPGNLRVPPIYRRYVETLADRSPTFRRQCLRLAAAPWLTVMLAPLPMRRVEAMRARTQFLVNADGRRMALIEIGTLDDQFELIAHEIEHVIEQLDGVDLRVRARLPSSGVRRCDNGESFETVRAIRAGRLAALEVRKGGR